MVYITVPIKASTCRQLALQYRRLHQALLDWPTTIPYVRLLLPLVRDAPHDQ